MKSTFRLVTELSLDCPLLCPPLLFQGELRDTASTHSLMSWSGQLMLRGPCCPPLRAAPQGGLCPGPVRSGSILAPPPRASASLTLTEGRGGLKKALGGRRTGVTQEVPRR